MHSMYGRLRGFNFAVGGLVLVSCSGSLEIVCGSGSASCTSQALLGIFLGLAQHRALRVKQASTAIPAVPPRATSALNRMTTAPHTHLPPGQQPATYVRKATTWTQMGRHASAVIR